MKSLRVRYTPEASLIIKKLHPEVKLQIRDGIRSLVKNPLSGHELQFELSGFRSCRVKTYRILYRYNEQKSFIEVIYVGHRRDVYESFRTLLSEKK